MGRPEMEDFSGNNGVYQLNRKMNKDHIYVLVFNVEVWLCICQILCLICLNSMFDHAHRVHHAQDSNLWNLMCSFPCVSQKKQLKWVGVKCPWSLREIPCLLVKYHVYLWNLRKIWSRNLWTPQHNLQYQHASRPIPSTEFGTLTTELDKKWFAG
jgi:hypothetical protein